MITSKENKHLASFQWVTMKIFRNTYKRIVTIYVLKAWKILILLHYNVKGNYLQVVNHYVFPIFYIFSDFYVLNSYYHLWDYDFKEQYPKH